ncbi:MAG: efflux RND transporter periplasmic adaptor subunit [Patescibacteria group bacterium]
MEEIEQNNNQQEEIIEPPKKKSFFRFRKTLYFIIAIVILTTVYFVFFANKESAFEFVAGKVEKGDLVQTVEATGDLEAVDEVELSYDVSGVIEEVLLKVGDSVEQDQVILRLNTDELTASADQAREALSAAQANLSQKNAGSTSEAVAVAQAVVDVAAAQLKAAEVSLQNAQADLDHTVLIGDATVAQAKAVVDSAQASLNNTLSTNTQSKKDAREDYVTVMQGNMIEVREALSDADEVIGVDNTMANDDYDDLLASLDGQTLIDAKNSYINAKSDMVTAENLVYALTTSSTQTLIDQATAEVAESLKSSTVTLMYTRRVLDATSIDTNAFSIEDLSTVKASIDTVRASLQLEYDSFVAQQQAYDSALITVKNNESTARNTLVEAQRKYDSSVATRDSNNSLTQSTVRSAQTTLDIRKSDLAQTQAQFAETQASPRSVDVAALQAEVRRAQAGLDSAQAKFAKAEIKAPFAGVVTDVTVEAGEQVSIGTHVATVQNLERQFKITSKISESDIIKVAQNQSADVTFDAFGDDKIFKGSVMQIDPAEISIEGVIYYQIDVALESNQSIGLKPGMSADVTILTKQVNDALYVPQRAVLEQNGRKFVRIPKDNEYEEQDVKIGIRADGGKLEITQGLNEGDEIILTIKNK